MLITENYRELNAELHSRVPTYGTGAHRWGPAVHLLCLQFGIDSVLDYGAGKGTLKRVLAGFHEVSEYDPAIPKIRHAPLPADMVCCLDVLEHVEPECLDEVLEHIWGLTRKVFLFDISCRVGGKKLADGRPAHINVRSSSWWIERLRALGNLRTLPSIEGEVAGYVLR